MIINLFVAVLTEVTGGTNPALVHMIVEIIGASPAHSKSEYRIVTTLRLLCKLADTLKAIIRLVASCTYFCNLFERNGTPGTPHAEARLAGEISGAYFEPEEVKQSEATKGD